MKASWTCYPPLVLHDMYTHKYIHIYIHIAWKEILVYTPLNIYMYMKSVHNMDMRVVDREEEEVR